MLPWASCLFKLFFTHFKRIWVFCWTRLLHVVLLEWLLWVLRWVLRSSPHGTGPVVKVLRTWLGHTVWKCFRSEVK